MSQALLQESSPTGQDAAGVPPPHQHGAMTLAHDSRIQLITELAGVADLLMEHPTHLVEPWPFPGGLGGPLRLADGTVAHGAYALEDDDHVELVVAADGWPIEHRRCPGPLLASSHMLGPANYWVSVQPIVSRRGGTDVCIGPEWAVLDRLIRRQKPLGLVDFLSEAEAVAWCRHAEANGVDVVTECSTDCPCGCDPVWFVSAARPEPFSELIDLDALASWYPLALEAAGASSALNRVVGNLTRLAAQSPTDYLERTWDLIAAPMHDGTGQGLDSEVTGIVLGYWPPTTAAFMSTATAEATGSRRYEQTHFPTWDAIRLAEAEWLPDLPVGHAGA